MKRAALISIPVLTIVLFVFVMNSGFLFLKPGGYDLQAHLGKIRKDVLNGDWQSVENEMGRLEYMFGRKILPFVQFSVEKSELQEMEQSIWHIKGCIDSQDRNMALIYLRELEYVWKNLNR